MNPITRRVFILSTLAAGTVLFLLPQGAKTPINIKPFKVIASVQEILLPKGGNAPSSSEFGATSYLINISTHASFWKEDLALLESGAYQLIKEEPNFFNLSKEDQSNVIEEFSETKIGRNWLALLLYYSLEALLSDPIYGGNHNELGWKWLEHNSGKPRPKEKWADLSPEKRHHEV